jgi:hypothetical protein
MLTSMPSGYKTIASLFNFELESSVIRSKAVPFLYLPWKAIMSGLGLLVSYVSGMYIRTRRLMRVPSPALLSKVKDLEGPPGFKEVLTFFPHPELAFGVAAAEDRSSVKTSWRRLNNMLMHRG